MTLNLINPDVSNFFEDNMAFEAQFVEDAISIEKPEKARDYLDVFQDHFRSLKFFFPSASDDIQAIETLQKKLVDSIDQLESKLITRAEILEEPTTSVPNFSKPVGIKPSGNNCAYNAIVQIVANSPHLKSLFMASPFQEIFADYASCQASGQRVSDLDINTVRELTGTARSNTTEEDVSEVEALSDMLTLLDAIENMQEEEALEYLPSILHSMITDQKIEYTSSSDCIDILRMLITSKIEKYFNTPQEDAWVELNKMLGIVTSEQGQDNIINVDDDYLWTQYGTEILSLQFQKCDDFKTQVQNACKNVLDIPPESLIVSRINGQFDADTTRIKPEYIDERQLSDDETNGEVIILDRDIPMHILHETTQYELTGCIKQMGGVNGGHFLALQRIMDEWYSIDGDLVTEIADHQANEYLQSGYVYFYARTDQEPITSPKIELQIPSWTKMAIGMICALGAAVYLGMYT